MSPQSDFWDLFWKYPETSNDIYEILTPLDIKTILDQNLANFCTLVRVLSTRFIYLTNDIAQNGSKSSTSELLNCIRLLTKLLPFLFEHSNYLTHLEQEIFWRGNYEPLNILHTPGSSDGDADWHKEVSVKATADGENLLGFKIMKSLVDVLFVSGFTMEGVKAAQTDQNRVLRVWEPGIGVRSRYNPPNLIIDSNRAEALKLILTIVSLPFYESPSNVVSDGSKFLTVLVTATPRVELLTLVCSLANLICRSSRNSTTENGMTFSEPLFTEVRYLCTTYAIQLLTLMLAYPLPSRKNLDFLFELKIIKTQKPLNMVRAYMGRLHKESELTFLASSLLCILKKPLVTSRDSEGSRFNIGGISQPSQPSLWAVEVIMIIWELIQCNKNFRAVISNRFYHELFITLLYHVHVYYKSARYKNIVRICSYFLFYLSSTYDSMSLLFSPINKNFYRTLPIDFVIEPCPYTYKDFIIIHICEFLIKVSEGKVINTSKRHSNLIVANLVEVLYNIIPANLSNTSDNDDNSSNDKALTGDLSYETCLSIMQLISKFSEESILLANSFNADLLALLVRAISTAMLKYAGSASALLVAAVKHEKVLDDVWNAVYSLKSEYFIEKSKSLDSINDEEENDSTNGTSNILNSDDHTTSPSINSPIERNPNSQGGIYISSDAISHSHHTDSGPEYDYLFAQESSSDDDAEAIDKSLRPSPLTGMSQKVREKLPLDTPFYRSWGGTDSLRAILLILIPFIKSNTDVFIKLDTNKISISAAIDQIKQLNFSEMIKANRSQISFDLLPDTPFDTLKFNWGYLSLGWYISLLFGDIYNALNDVRLHTRGNAIMKTLSTSFVALGKFTSALTGFSEVLNNSADTSKTIEWLKNGMTSINQWSQTSIKLFNIEPIENEGIFDAFSNKLGLASNSQAVPGTPRGSYDSLSPLAKRLNEFKVNNQSFSSISSMNSGNSIMAEEDTQRPRYSARNSVSSLHSLNTINRSRTATPKTSMSKN